MKHNLSVTLVDQRGTHDPIPQSPFVSPNNNYNHKSLEVGR